MEVLQLILLAILPALVIVAGLKDLTSMKIPNWISGLLILGFFPAALLLGLQPSAIGIHLAVAVAVRRRRDGYPPPVTRSILKDFKPAG